MRKLWVYCCARVDGEEEIEMKEKGRASASVINIHSSSDSQLQEIYERKKYERNLQGIKKIAFVTDLTSICNWFLGFCALTWASAVLLGSYIEKLSKWDYYEVSLLLLVEGLRFGLAGFLRLLGYRLSECIRWALQSLAFYILPLGMGGFAVMSILPADIRHSIHQTISGHSGSLLLSGHMSSTVTTISHTVDAAPPPPDSGYESLSPSLHIFFTLVLLNAFFLLLGSSVAGLMRRRYVGSNVYKSLRIYHDKMLDSSTSWLHPSVDLNFAFEIQGARYSKGRHARYVCEKYTDLIWYVYMHDKGVEAAEVALTAEDGCVREAAANTMGFWAVLETLEEVQGPKLPLCLQRGMLSKLADIAADSYGSLGTAAARAFSLLLELVDLKLIGMVACVRSKGTDQDLIDILLSRTAELLHPPCPTTYSLPRILREESHAHVYALRQYLLRLQSTACVEGSNVAVRDFIEAQRAQLVEKVEKALPEMVKKSNVSTIQSLDNQLSILLPSIEPADHKNYYSDIKSRLTAPSPPPTWASPIKATFLLLCNVAVPLVCLGVGFIVNALL